MLILHIDSSADLCSVALARDGEEKGFEINQEPFSHGSDINLLIERLNRKAGLRMKDIDAVSVNKGPGSFTALRIGMATAKGICFGLEVPLLTPDGLEVLVSHAMNGYPDYDYYIPMIDARRMEVYTVDPVRGTEEEFRYNSRVLDLNSFQELRDQKICFVGNGVEKWDEIAPEHPGWRYEPIDIDARMMIPLSHQYAFGNKFSNLFSANPVYIKKPNITQSKKQYF